MSIAQLGQVSAAEPESFFASGSDEAGNLRLEVNITGETGDFDIETNLETVGPLDLGPGVGIGDLSIVVGVAGGGLSNIRARLNDAPQRISNLTGISERSASRFLDQNIPSNSEFDFTEDIPVGVTLPQEDNFSVQFRPSVVPVLQEERNFVDQIDDELRRQDRLPRISVRVVPRGVFGTSLQQLTGGVVVQDTPEVEVQLPLEAFITTRDISDLPCGDLFSNVESGINRIGQQVEPISNTMQRRLQSLQNIEDSLASEIGVGSISGVTRADLSEGQLSDLGEFTLQDFQLQQGPPPTNLQELRNTIENIDVTPDVSFASLRSDIQDLQADVDDVGLPGCSSEFQSELSQARSSVENLQSTVNEAQALKQDLLNFLNTLDLPLVEAAGCLEEWGDIQDDIADVRRETQNLNNQINNLQNRVTDFRQRVQRIGFDVESELQAQDLQSTRQELRSRSDELTQAVTNTMNGLGEIESRVENEVDRSRCIRQFTSSIQSLRGNLNTLQTRVNDITVAQLPDFDLPIGPCLEQIPTNFQNAIDEYQSSVNDFTSLSPQQRATNVRRRLENRGQDLLDTLEEDINASADCKQQFRAVISNTRNRVIGATATTCAQEIPASLRADIDSYTSSVENFINASSSQQTQNRRGQLQDRGDQLIQTIRSAGGGEGGFPVEDSWRVGTDTFNSIFTLALLDVTAVSNGVEATVSMRNAPQEPLPSGDQDIDNFGALRGVDVRVNAAGATPETISFGTFRDRVPEETVLLEGVAPEATVTARVINPDDLADDAVNQLNLEQGNYPVVVSATSTGATGISPECRDELFASVNQAQSRLQQVNVTRGALGACRDEFSNAIISEVNNYETDAQSFAEAGRRAKTRSRKNRLLNNGEQIKQRIRATDASSNCQQILIDRTNQAQTVVRNVQAVEDRPPTCDERFSSTADDITEWEDEILEVDSDDSDTIISLINQGQNLIQQVQNNVTNVDCVMEFTDRIEGGLTRLERISGRGVRVVTEEELQQELEGGQAQIDELRAQLEQIQLPERAQQVEFGQSD